MICNESCQLFMHISAKYYTKDHHKDRRKAVRMGGMFKFPSNSSREETLKQLEIASALINSLFDDDTITREIRFLWTIDGVELKTEYSLSESLELFR